MQLVDRGQNPCAVVPHQTKVLVWLGEEVSWWIFRRGSGQLDPLEWPPWQDATLQLCGWTVLVSLVRSFNEFCSKNCRDVTMLVKQIFHDLQCNFIERSEQHCRP